MKWVKYQNESHLGLKGQNKPR